MWVWVMKMEGGAGSREEGEKGKSLLFALSFTFQVSHHSSITTSRTHLYVPKCSLRNPRQFPLAERTP